MEWSFTDKSNWTGPFFELVFELGPHPESIAETRRALDFLWQHPTLDGPYESHHVPVDRQPKAVIGDEEPAGLHFYGMATWPDGSRSPCGAVPSIPQPYPDELQRRFRLSSSPLESLADELIFYVPSLYGGPRSIDWWDEIDGELDAAIRYWLADLAEHVFRSVPFVLAAIGPEALWELERGESGDAPVPGVTVLRPNREGRLIRLDANR